MICLVQNGKEIGRLLPYPTESFMNGYWRGIIYEWGKNGQIITALDSHLRNLLHFFPDVEFVYVP